jgi:UDP:flavonoid glycosyltransferase YjiC (YdhE family)
LLKLIGENEPAGTPRKNEKVQLSPNLPALSTADFFWNCPQNLDDQKIMFNYAIAIQQKIKVSNWLLCNWFHELDPSAPDFIPNMLPIGPLLANERPVGNLYREDLTCLSWLNKQPAGSVIYVAFGSTSLVSISQHQFDELALGLELIGRPFLWVNKSDLITKGINSKFPDGLGKIVQWAPQEKVLAHPSVACFLTHCGWNSTMEGLSSGVPFLCWPHFGDQLYVQSCICDVWKVGLPLKPDDNGIIARDEFKSKIDELLSDDGIRANSLKLKNMAIESVRKGGSSSKNLEDFIEQIKH